MKSESTRLSIAFLVLALIYAIAYWGYTDLRVKYIAREVVSPDDKYAFKSQTSAQRIGPELLPLLVSESKGFSEMTSANASRISDVLGSYKTPEAAKIAQELYEREDVWSRLAGAHALAHHDILPDTLDSNSFLVEQLLTSKGKGSWENEAGNLAAETLAHYDIEKLIPVFIESGLAEYLPYTACRKLVEATTPDALEPLRSCLKSCNYDCGLLAFRLLNLGDKEAITILIEELSDGNRLATFADQQVALLSSITGQDFPVAEEPWQKWWEENKATWAIPLRFASEEGKKEFQRSYRKDTADHSRVLYLIVSGFLILVLYFVYRAVTVFRSGVTSEPLTAPFQYAGFSPRARAVFIDLVILSPLSILSYLAMSFQTALVALSFLAVALLGNLYRVYFHTRFGATPGKLICGIAVLTPEGDAISMKQAIYRQLIDFLFSIVAALGGVAAFASLADSSRALTILEQREIAEGLTPAWAEVSEWTAIGWCLLQILVFYMNSKHRAVHDFIADTVVVHRYKRTEILIPGHPGSKQESGDSNEL